MLHSKYARTLILIAIIILIAGIVFLYVSKTEEEPVPEPVQNELIRVSYPKAGDTVTSPFTVRGEARGQWYFEASFPVVLVDWDGRIIAQGIATAQSDWMTTDFVPFTATLTFDTKEKRYSNRGALILQKSNASGLPEHDDALEIPIILGGAGEVTPPPPTSSSSTLRLSVGETGTVGGLSVTLNAFVQDSRCPVDVVCIQAGAVTVNVSFSTKAHTVTKNMPSDEVPQEFDGYRISITDIAPARKSNTEIPSQDYRITFFVEKL